MHTFSFIMILDAREKKRIVVNNTVIKISLIFKL